MSRLSPVEVAAATRAYNFHSHTQFCDGRAPMEEMAAAALDQGMEHYGFSPHSPIICPSGANMKAEDLQAYFDEAERLREVYDGRMELYVGMEIDWLNADFGPHIDMFQKLPLDYSIGSVHFLKSREGEWVDIDGRPERFLCYLDEKFGGDLRGVVERYFEQELYMIERGGFTILGHCDKISRNASARDPQIETYGWYQALLDDVVEACVSRCLPVEINTRRADSEDRYFPRETLWRRLAEGDVPLIVNSDAHEPSGISSGRDKAFAALKRLEIKTP